MAANTPRKDQIRIVKKDFKIPEQALSDIDEAIINYITKTIGLYVIENSEKISVPIFLGTHERWAQIKKQRTFRDANKKQILPVGRLNRNNTDLIEDRFVPEAIGNQITVIKKLAKENEWKNTSTKSGVNVRQPIAIAYDINVPPAIEINYTLQFWARYIKSMDFIQEQILLNNSNFAIKQKDYYYLNVKITSFSDESNMDDFSDELRLIASSAEITVRGYLFSNYKNKKQNFRKIYSPGKMIFTEKVVV